MRIAAPFRPDLAPFEAFTASLRVWLVGLVVWLADLEARAKSPALRAIVRAWLNTCAPLIRADLRQTAHELRYILFIQAFARVRLPQRRRGARRPIGAPAGFARQGVRGGVRRLTGGALSGLNEGALLDRARRLKSILDNPEPIIAAIVRRLLRLVRRFRTASLIAIAPPRVRCLSAAASAPALADTS